MSTSFCGHKTGFKRGDRNDVVPSVDGVMTTFGGRPAVPAGPLKTIPGLVSNTGAGNRRLAKNQHGEGGGMPTNIKGVNAFGGGARSTSMGKPRAYNISGGKSSGIRGNGSKKP